MQYGLGFPTYLYALSSGVGAHRSLSIIVEDTTSEAVTDLSGQIMRQPR